MKTKAAVVYEPGKRIEIEELDLDGPKDGEVLIRYTHAGLCHSDIHIAHGDLPGLSHVVVDGEALVDGRSRQHRDAAHQAHRLSSAAGLPVP